MAKIEREVGATCLKDQSGKIFLDELSPNRGEMPEEFIPDCSLICQIEFQELLDRQVERVLKGEISINDVVWKAQNDIEMNDGVYFDQNGNEVIVINGFEYSREEFDSLVDMCGDCNM